MYCLFCRSRLPKEARVCPVCGNLAPSPYIEASDATVPSASLQKTDILPPPVPSANLQKTDIPNIPPPPDPYNPSSPLGDSQPLMANPYRDQSHPYNNISTSLLSDSSLLSSPFPIPKKQSFSLGRTILLLGILLGIGTILLPHLQSLLGHSKTPSIETVVTSDPILPPTQAQSLYNQTIQATPTLNDVLAGPDNYGWDNYSQGNNTSCFFSGNTYHAMASPNYFSPCYAKATNYSDFIFQAQVTFVSGHSAGIVFRADSTNDKGYRFRISTDGTYILNKFFFDSAGQPQQNILTSGQSPLIATGASQPNLIATIARGTSIYLFVNNKYLDHGSDGTYSSGQIGVYVDSDAKGVEADFFNARVWKL